MGKEGVKSYPKKWEVLGNLLEKGAIKCEKLLWSDKWQLKFENLNLKLIIN